MNQKFRERPFEMDGCFEGGFQLLDYIYYCLGFEWLVADDCLSNWSLTYLLLNCQSPATCVVRPSILQKFQCKQIVSENTVT